MYYSIDIAAGSEESFDCGKIPPCVVTQLKPFSDYSLSMSVKNGAGEGPRSETVSFATLQGRKWIYSSLIIHQVIKTPIDGMHEPFPTSSVLSTFL